MRIEKRVESVPGENTPIDFVTITYYVSDDGYWFEDEEECIRWEQFKQMPQFYFNPPFVSLEYECVWVYVKNEDDLTLAIDAQLNADANKDYEGPESYPAWVCIQYEPEDDYFGEVLGTVSQIEKGMNSFMKSVLAEQVKTMNDLIQQKYPEETK